MTQHSTTCHDMAGHGMALPDPDPSQHIACDDSPRSHLHFCQSWLAAACNAPRCVNDGVEVNCCIDSKPGSCTGSPCLLLLLPCWWLGDAYGYGQVRLADTALPVHAAAAARETIQSRTSSEFLLLCCRRMQLVQDERSAQGACTLASMHAGHSTHIAQPKCGGWLHSLPACGGPAKSAGVPSCAEAVRPGIM